MTIEQETGIERLQLLMRETAVKFSYEKNDGSVRVAYGTLAENVIAQYAAEHASDHKRRNGHATSEWVIPYFDLEKGAWRCFRKDAFLGIDEDYGI